MGKRRRGAPKHDPTWKEGPVDPSREYFEIWTGDPWHPETRRRVARVIVTPTGPHTVQFFSEEIPPPDREGLRERLARELSFYLVELREEDVFAYMRYHARNTASNIYSEFHWDLIPPSVSER